MSTKKLLLALFLAVAVLAAACGSDDDDDSSGGDDAAADEETEAADEEEPAEDEAADEEPAEDEAADDEAAADDEEMAGTWDIDAALAADPDCADPVTGDGLIIGYAADLSDLGGFADAPASAAADHFVNQINCSGGIDGVPVELIIQNIEGDPDVTQRAAQDLIDAGVHAILGPPFPDFGQPLLQVTQGDVPVVFVASTEPTLPNPEIQSYLVAFDDTAQATAAAEFAIDQGWETAVTFSAPGPYFGYNPEVFTEVFEAAGGTVLGDYNFVPETDVDFSTQVNEIANLGESPDVLYTAMLAFQAAPLAEQLASAGVEVEILMTDAFEATGGYVTDGTEGFFHTTHTFPEPGSRVVILNESFEAATGAGLENPSFGGLAVDAIAVVIEAFQRTGSTDPAVIGAAIAEASGVEGVTGTLTYADSVIPGVPDKPVYIHEVVDGLPTLADTWG